MKNEKLDSEGWTINDETGSIKYFITWKEENMNLTYVDDNFLFVFAFFALPFEFWVLSNIMCLVDLIFDVSLGKLCPVDCTLYII